MGRLYQGRRSMVKESWQTIASMLSARTIFMVMVLVLHCAVVNCQVSGDSSIASPSIIPSTSLSVAPTQQPSSSASTSPSSSSSLSSSTTAAATTPTTSTIQPTTVDPTLCNPESAQKCINKLAEYYAMNGTGINGTSELFRHVLGGLHCQPLIASMNKSCVAQIPLSNCTDLKSVSKWGHLSADQYNFTQFSLLCTNEGTLVPIAWDPERCPSNFKRSVELSTAAFCSVAGNITSTTNTSSFISLNCKYNLTAQPHIDPASLLEKSVIDSGCNIVKPKTTTAIPLSPNPVSPAAITAIVVLICLTIIAILAAFFFWPKCHISDPALIPKKKKQNEGMINDGFDFAGASGGAQYNARIDAVAMKIPPNYGPSAA